MPISDDTIRVMAGAVMKLQAQLQAQDLLLRGLYAERALQRGTFPQEAAEEVLGLGASLPSDPEDFEGHERHLADVRAALNAFAMTLKAQLDEARV
ncbi:hypothetical protein [Aureimonas phyllosphaerae]|uniref:Fructose-specific component phosphotransferase system IIB-like protein n=1 Tax=Aureimonas phyllosphaerae TaxID=1166078 RepID=A0A7W6BYR7_9HYPH|nr:hypothetical protein [Aureimonas phyllosphaerae]MBB3936161.1 fructose-specific component phosphotransferase system IIB-like protein [Aureimonas phyllosphaerae]MBB3960114.1 fructose-specific component phosphotransferase system IIB-like protein [Aureimonas phyllosphaerae]SFF33406.1 hypothetical protein SAMN05216566_10897 [Aureimonas phyllosphaerae]